MKIKVIVLKQIFKSLVVLMLLSSSQSYAAKGDEIALIMSPAVRDSIQKASSDERKKMEAAISTGNKFIPHHFNGKAYGKNDEDEIKFWNRNIRPLVNKNIEEWFGADEVYTVKLESLIINGVKVDSVVVCPQLELVSIIEMDGKFQLKYRAKIIGTWKTSVTYGLVGDILLNDKSEYDEVIITFDANNKISNISVKYQANPSYPEIGIKIYELRIKSPPRRLYQSANGLIQETEFEAKAKIQDYKKYIDLIRKEERDICEK